MELKQIRTVLDVRRNYLMTVLGVSVLAILIFGILCGNAPSYGIPVFTICIFAVFIIVLSIFYDIYINSTYRLFIDGDDLYIYYPTYSTRAGNEFIFYKVLDIQYATMKGSSIIFEGWFQVHTEGIERENIGDVQDVHALFEDVFSGEQVYKIKKRFRVSRIFAQENKLMGLLSSKRATSEARSQEES